MRRLRRNLSSSRLETCVVADFPVSKQLSFSVEREKNFVNERSFQSAIFFRKSARLDDLEYKATTTAKMNAAAACGRRRRHARAFDTHKKKSNRRGGRTFLGVWPSTTIGLCQGGAAIFSNPISRMRCMFFAILRSRMRSNSESPLKFFSSSFSSSLSFAVAAWCCCPGVVGGENRRIVVVSLIADIFYFFFLYVPEKRRFFLRFFWRESFLFIFSLFVFSSSRILIEDEIFNAIQDEHTHTHVLWEKAIIISFWLYTRIKVSRSHFFLRVVVVVVALVVVVF